VTAPKQDKGPLRKRGYKPAPINQRFWSKVDMSNPFGCWPWLGYRYNGYGRFNYEGRSTKAHRVAWFLRHGFVSSDKHICHRCDNPACCNPDHMFLGNAWANAQDRTRKGRSKGGSQPGERHPQAKLTWSTVRTIRRLFNEGAAMPALAREYGVSKENVRLIVRNQGWIEEKVL